MSNSASDLTTIAANRFLSLESMRAAHGDLLQHWRENADGPEALAEIEAFLQRGQATGALVDEDSQRRAAQNMLDYWATRVYRADYRPPDATLADFDPALAPELTEDLCPYLGLNAFTEYKKDKFFGRGPLVAEMLNFLRNNRMLALLGSSGSGKSSLVRAGLIPELKAGALPGSSSWHYLPALVPGSNPLVNLARRTRPPEAPLEDWLPAETANYCRTPDHLAELVAKSYAGPVVLVIDQLEEIFTLCTDDQIRNAFIANLIGLLKAPQAGHRLILTMRTDYEPAIARLPEFQPLFEYAVMRVTPLGPKELREAIETPAQLVGLKFEDGVVDDLIKDVLGEEAALPLLQFTLLELWNRRERNRVTYDTYQRLGGGRKALGTIADEFYETLIPEDQVTARRILLKLVRPGEGTEVTSSRVLRSRLYHRSDPAIRVDKVLDRLVAAGLVRLSEGDADEDDQIEVAHEALVRNWPRLVDWLDDERLTMRQRLRLTTAAEQWQRLGRDPDALRRGQLLGESLRFEDLSPLEDEFVRASREAEEAADVARRRAEQQALEIELVQKLAAAEKQRAEEHAAAAHQLRTRARYLAITLGVALALLIAAIFLGVQSARNANAAEIAKQTAVAGQAIAEAAKAEAVQQQALAQSAEARAVDQRAVAEAAQAEADTERQRAFASQLAAQAISYLDDQLDLALLLSAEAYQRTEDNAEDRSSLLSGMAYNPQLITFLRGHTDLVASLAYSPNGKVLASTGYDGRTILWDVSDPLNGARPIGEPLFGYGYGVSSLAFSPDGALLAVIGPDASVVLWDVSNPEQGIGPIGDPLFVSQASTNTLAFSPLAGSHILALGGCGLDENGFCAKGEILLWDITDPRQIKPIGQFESDLYSFATFAFSPDGATLAAAGSDASIELWDVGTGQRIGPLLEGHLSSITTLAFSFDNRILASGSSDNTIILWDVSDLQRGVKPLDPPLVSYAGGVTSLAFSPNDQTLISGNANGAIWMWNVTDHLPVGQPLIGHTSQVADLAFSPNGQLFASGSYDANIILWSVTVNQTLLAPGGWVNSVAFSPDGSRLASGSDDGQIRLWEPITGELVEPLFSGHTGYVQSVAFSPDGETLASGSWDKTVRLWDLATGQEQVPALVGHLGAVQDVAFEPQAGSHLLVSASCEQDNVVQGSCEHGEIRLWDTETGRQLGPPVSAHDKNIYTLAFSPDGSLLVSGGGDGKVILWDVSESQTEITRRGELPARSLTAVWSLAFSADGKLLASGNCQLNGTGECVQGDIQLWDFSDPESPAPLGSPLTGRAVSILSLAFSPDGQTLAAGDGDGLITLWDVNLGQPTSEPLVGHKSSVLSLAFRPNGQTLASGSSDSTIVLWDLVTNSQSWPERVCRIVSRNLTATEWQKFLPEEDYRPTCPEIPLNPYDLYDLAEKYSLEGKTELAADFFSQAVPLAIETDDAFLNNTICWFGSIDGFAKTVLPACERAVELVPDDGGAIDSRGLARALTGDYAGAIADFKVFLKQLKDGTLYFDNPQKLIDERESFIAALEAGQNPFDQETLDLLRNE